MIRRAETPCRRAVASIAVAFLVPMLVAGCGVVGNDGRQDASTACVQPAARLDVSSDTGDEVVDTVAFTADGTTIATQGRPIQLWDTATGALRKTIKHRFNRLNAMEFSPDGTSLALASDATRVRDFLGGEPTAPGASDSGSSYPVALWNVKTGQPGNLLIHSGAVGTVRFSPAGGAIATMPSLGSTAIALWKSASVRSSTALDGHTPQAMGFEFGQDGKTLAVASSRETIRLWDWPTGKLRHTLQTPAKAHRRIAFSPDGRHLSSFNLDGPIHIWDVATGALVSRVTVPRFTVDFAYQADGALVVLYGDSEVGRFDATTGRQVATMRFCTTPGQVRSAVYLRFNAAGTTFATSQVTSSGQHVVQLYPISF